MIKPPVHFDSDSTWVVKVFMIHQFDLFRVFDMLFIRQNAHWPFTLFCVHKFKGLWRTRVWNYFDQCANRSIKAFFKAWLLEVKQHHQTPRGFHFCTLCHSFQLEGLLMTSNFSTHSRLLVWWCHDGHEKCVHCKQFCRHFDILMLPLLKKHDRYIFSKRTASQMLLETKTACKMRNATQTSW